MTSSYDFILNEMTFSYSSVNTYLTCPQCFYLTYIAAEERIGGFFGIYGNYIHDILMKYFQGELDAYELSQHYRENYSNVVNIQPPPFPKGMSETYYNDGLEFFDNFEFNREDYEVILIEDKLETEYNNVKLVVKPDLVLRDKSTGEYILYDYKTSKLKYNKQDDEKISGYLKQMYLYVDFIWKTKNIPITKIRLWFVRNNDIKEFTFDPYIHQEEVENWFFGNIEKIKNDEEYTAKPSSYFCNYLCNTNSSCKYRK